MRNFQNTLRYLSEQGYSPLESTPREYQGKVVAIMGTENSQALLLEQGISEEPDFFIFHNSITSTLPPGYFSHIRKIPSIGDKLTYTAYRIDAQGQAQIIRGNQRERVMTTELSGLKISEDESMFIKDEDLNLLTNQDLHEILLSWGYEFVSSGHAGYTGPAIYVFRPKIAGSIKQHLKLDEIPLFAHVRRGKISSDEMSIEEAIKKIKMNYNLFTLDRGADNPKPIPVGWSKRLGQEKEVKRALRLEAIKNNFETIGGVYILKKHLNSQI